MKNKLTRLSAVPVLVACMVYFGFSCGCNIYRFNEATIPDSIRTINVKFIENRARIINPQLSPQLTNRLRQKITAQTRLTQTNSETADWEVSSFVTDYNVSTSGISNQQAVQNRLTVAIHVTLFDRKSEETKEHDVSRSFEFKGNLSLQQAENQLMDEMVKTLTDEIFNKLFSNW